MLVTERTTATQLRTALDATAVVETDATAALDRLDGGGFDCVVCDYDLDGASGIELLAAARQRDPTLSFVVRAGDREAHVRTVLAEDESTTILGADGVDAVEAVQQVCQPRGVTATRSVQSATRWQALERVNKATRQFLGAATTGEIATIAVEAARDAFETDLVSIWYVTDDRDALRLETATRPLRDLLSTAGEPPFVHERGDRVWEAFEDAGPHVLANLEPEDLAAAVPVQTALVAALGSHGIVSIARRDDHAFGDAERDLARILARSARAALDRLDRKRELTQNRDLLERAQRLADVGAWEYDGSGTIHLTAQTRRLSDLPLEGPVSFDDGLAVYHPEDRDRIETAVDRALEFGIGFDYRVRIVRDDGVRRVRVVGEPVFESGTVDTVRGALLDVTSAYRQRRQLERNERALRRLHELVADTRLSFDERIEAMLEVGVERAGLAAGYLTSVDDETVEISHLVGDAPGLHEGACLPLAETFCRKVTDREAVISIYDAPAQGFAEDPAYRRFELDSYVGAPFFLGDELRGTLCFVDPEPRDRPFPEIQRTFIRLLVQQVAALFERRRRREQLQALHKATQSLFAAETTDEIPSLTIQSVEAVADSFPVAFYRWDEDSGTLVLADDTAPSTAGAQRPEQIQPGDDPVWTAFVRNDPTLEPLQIERETADSGFVVPIQDFGVLVADQAAESPETVFGHAFLQTLARSVAAALETVRQNEQLQSYTERLERRNDQLERLRRINAIVRDTQRTLVEADSRSAIETAVCENLTAIEHWELAWIGAPDHPGRSFTVRASSGPEAKSLAAASDFDGQGSIAHAAFDQQRIVERSRLLAADGPEPWRRTAIEQGHQSAISIPISYESRAYGVLEIYADRPGAFSDSERSVLAELGTTIAYAIAAVEQRQVLRADSHVVLECSMPTDGEWLLELAATLETDLCVTHVVPRTDGGYLAYARTDEPDRVATALGTLPVVDRANEFGANTAERVEFGFRSSQLLDVLATYDARLDQFVVDGQTNALRVRLPRPDQVRAFVEHLRQHYPESTVRAQRAVEEPVVSSLPGVFESLTDRQREVVSVAHQRGFFAWPRESSGEAVAEALGIAPATFHEHVRAVEQRVFEALFGPRE
ncbi:Signal transduction regulator [Halapricum desulfuricans]|uniref:Signal transduction regulator n=1 Tax=Halapricum desulfuricans TaxID=2841257 RepID=A0A897NGI9_9EURY|nr:GAF domain-containing protein [Halapricum desulfuricans]QSG11554.1 Signal transduction regulator [Halapricum desulfuricans]